MKFIGLFLLIVAAIGVITQVISIAISLSFTLSQATYTFGDILEKLGFHAIFLLPILFFYWIGISLYKGKWKV